MKGYLLDTHALMWAINEPSRLGGRAVEVLRDRGNLVVVSAASAWELHTKNRIGKLPGAGPWLDGLLGVFRTVLVLCFRLPSSGPGNRFRPRRECDTLGLSEDEYDCISARSMRQYP